MFARRLFFFCPDLRISPSSCVSMRSTATGERLDWRTLNLNEPFTHGRSHFLFANFTPRGGERCHSTWSNPPLLPRPRPPQLSHLPPSSPHPLIPSCSSYSAVPSPPPPPLSPRLLSPGAGGVSLTPPSGWEEEGALVVGSHWTAVVDDSLSSNLYSSPQNSSSFLIQFVVKIPRLVLVLSSSSFFITNYPPPPHHSLPPHILLECSSNASRIAFLLIAIKF